VDCTLYKRRKTGKYYADLVFNLNFYSNTDSDLSTRQIASLMMTEFGPPNVTEEWSFNGDKGEVRANFNGTSKNIIVTPVFNVSIITEEQAQANISKETNASNNYYYIADNSSFNYGYQLTRPNDGEHGTTYNQGVLDVQHIQNAGERLIKHEPWHTVAIYSRWIDGEPSAGNHPKQFAIESIAVAGEWHGLSIMDGGEAFYRADFDALYNPYYGQGNEYRWGDRSLFEINFNGDYENLPSNTQIVLGNNIDNTVYSAETYRSAWGQRGDTRTQPQSQEQIPSFLQATQLPQGFN